MYRRENYKCARDTDKIAPLIFLENGMTSQKKKHSGKGITIACATAVFFFFFVVSSYSSE